MSRKDLVPDSGPVLTLRKALYRASRDYRGGQATLALDMGVDADKLCKQLNPNDARPISPEWIEEIIGFTRHPQLLDAVCRPAGALWFHVAPVAATHEALREMGRFCEREAKFIDSLADGAADGKWELHEVDRLEAHGRELISKLLGIMAGARQAMEEDVHG